jgi:hypothetical protein
MSGTRKLEKFELDRLATHESGTRRLEKFDLADVEPPASLGARAIDREPDVERLRTRLARKFTSLADNVTEGFHDFRIGAGSWSVELTAPEGMSTSGGKQVLQYLRLRPKRQGHAVLVGGVVNPVTKTAQLRDHEHMELIFRARFGAALDVTPGEWEQFLRKAEVVLHEEEIATARVSAPRDVRDLAHQGAPSGASKRPLAAFALGVVVLLAAIVMWRVFVTLSP